MGADNASLATLMEPDKLDELCEFTTSRIQEYIRLLTSAGAQLICILEPSGVMLGPEEFERFSARYIKDICNNYKYSDTAIIYHTCGNTMMLIEKMAESGVDALSLDSPGAGVELPEVAKRVDKNIILMGNIDPTGSILNGQPDEVEKEVIDLMESMGSYENFVLSTGCDLPQQVPIENIHAFMKAGRNYRIKKK
jgi:uroporphyrinogen decarboxylase